MSELKQYVGTKIVSCLPMNRQEYDDYRGWELPSNENGADEGFLVEYKDGGVANDPRHIGYISWSPKEVFEKSYEADGSLSFGSALLLLKTGHRICRRGWNGRGMFIRLVYKTDVLNTHFEILNTSGTFDTWVPSVSDCLAEDWMVAS